MQTTRDTNPHYMAHADRLDLSPRRGVVPTPFAAERAAAIREEAKAVAKYASWFESIAKVMTPGEEAYVIAVWDTIPSGSSNFMSGFFAILNGEI